MQNSMTDRQNPSTAEDAAKRRRLFKPSDASPWVPADRKQLPEVLLFWLPVSGFPLQHDERTWLSEFLTRLSQRLERDAGLRGEIFLQFKSVEGELVDRFFHYTQKNLKLMGVGRRHNEPLASFPSPDEVRKLLEDGKQVDIKQWIGEFTYWFIAKQPIIQRELFLGYGGMITIFLPADPNTQAPRIPFNANLRASIPLFQQFDVDSVHAATYALQDAFLKKSKALFGAGLEDRPEYPGISFILPLLNSAQFFIADSAARFNLFDVYIHESKPDKGILLAFQKEAYEPMLIEVLDSMRDDDLILGRRT